LQALNARSGAVRARRRARALLGAVLAATATAVMGAASGAVPTGERGGARLAQTPPAQGCWELSLSLGMLGAVHGRLNLEVRGTVLSGTFTGPRGRTEPVLQGAVSGTHVSFVLRGPHGLLNFDGALDPASGMHGTARPSRVGQPPREGGFGLPWRAERCP
jgi:hypothetical protein